MNWETKNRCGKSELNQQLYRIERECRDEMRMHDTRAQQFKTRRSRLNFYLDKAVNDSNGKNRNLGLSEGGGSPSSVLYEDVHAMLFTNGELDVEKVLCLHLLTAHRAETLRPPVKTKRPISFLAKDQSPLEKLIERSRKRRIIDKHPKLTPTYVLDINNKNEDESEDDCVIRDGRLAERIIINDKILILIHTVLDALQLSNPEKMAELMSKAQDENILKEIIEKPYLQDFLQTLQKQLIISSCDSFHLSQPFKAPTVSLQVDPSALSLKSLVNYIRRNVLQNSLESTWGEMYDKDMGSKEEEVISSYFYDKSLSKVSIEDLSSRTRYRLDINSEVDVMSKPGPSKDITENLTQRTMDHSDPKTSKSTVSTEYDSLCTASTPKRRKPQITNLEQIDDDNIRRIDVDQLALIVDLHMKRLNCEDKRPTMYQKSTPLNVSDNTAKGRVGFKATRGSVDLNVYDLARISQEIRERETQQKLEKFLKNAAESSNNVITYK